MEQEKIPVRVVLEGTTVEERLLMMWSLTVQAWLFKGDDHRGSRLQRQVVRLLRREG